METEDPEVYGRISGRLGPTDASLNFRNVDVGKRLQRLR